MHLRLLIFSLWITEAGCYNTFCISWCTLENAVVKCDREAELDFPKLSNCIQQHKSPLAVDLLKTSAVCNCRFLEFAKVVEDTGGLLFHDILCGSQTIKACVPMRIPSQQTENYVPVYALYMGHIFDTTNPTFGNTLMEVYGTQADKLTMITDKSLRQMYQKAHEDELQQAVFDVDTMPEKAQKPEFKVTERKKIGALSSRLSKKHIEDLPDYTILRKEVFYFCCLNTAVLIVLIIVLTRQYLYQPDFHYKETYRKADAFLHPGWTHRSQASSRKPSAQPSQHDYVRKPSTPFSELTAPSMQEQARKPSAQYSEFGSQDQSRKPEPSVHFSEAGSQGQPRKQGTLYSETGSQGQQQSEPSVPFSEAGSESQQQTEPSGHFSEGGSQGHGGSVQASQAGTPSIEEGSQGSGKRSNRNTPTYFVTGDNMFPDKALLFQQRLVSQSPNRRIEDRFSPDMGAMSREKKKEQKDDLYLQMLAKKMLEHNRDVRSDPSLPTQHLRVGKKVFSPSTVLKDKRTEADQDVQAEGQRYKDSKQSPVMMIGDKPFSKSELERKLEKILESPSFRDHRDPSRKSPIFAVGDNTDIEVQMLMKQPGKPQTEGENLDKAEYFMQATRYMPQDGKKNDEFFMESVGHQQREDAVCDKAEFFMESVPYQASVNKPSRSGSRASSGKGSSGKGSSGRASSGRASSIRASGSRASIDKHFQPVYINQIEDIAERKTDIVVPVESVRSLHEKTSAEMFAEGYQLEQKPASIQIRPESRTQERTDEKEEAGLSPIENVVLLPKRKVTRKKTFLDNKSPEACFINEYSSSDSVLPDSEDEYHTEKIVLHDSSAENLLEDSETEKLARDTMETHRQLSKIICDYLNYPMNVPTHTKKKLKAEKTPKVKYYHEPLMELEQNRNISERAIAVDQLLFDNSEQDLIGVKDEEKVRLVKEEKKKKKWKTKSRFLRKK